MNEISVKSSDPEISINIASLQNVTFQTANAPSLEKALGVVISAILEEINADACSIFLIHDAFHLILAASQGLKTSAVNSLIIPLTEGLVSKIVKQAEPINLEDAQESSDFLVCEGIGEEHYHAFLGVPISVRGEVLGVIVLQRKIHRKFSETSVAYTQTLATQVASWLALSRMRDAFLPDQNNVKKPEDFVQGLPGSPGITLGTGVVIVSDGDAMIANDEQTGSIEEELKKLYQAINEVGREFRELADKTDLGLGEAETAIFEAYASIAESHDIKTVSENEVRHGLSAINAVRTTIVNYAAQFRMLNDDYMRARASDIEHIGRRIINYLKAFSHIETEFPENTVLVGDSLSIYDLVSVPRNRLKGVISGDGSSHSHLAILSRAMNIPAVLGLSEIIPPGALHLRELALDGYSGKIYIDPSKDIKSEFSFALQQESLFSQELIALKDVPAQTPDGFTVSLMVNAGITADVSHVNQLGADGIGLFRTEFPFISSDHFLTEDEQFEIYREILSGAHPKPVVMRTLDIGGDKALPYWPIEEENPFLGWRGIRITSDHPEIFFAQVRAMIRANQDFGNLRILLPMVNCVEDIEICKAMINKVTEELGKEKKSINQVPVGVMIEVPSMVYSMGAVNDLVDFYSIGSNDLTQYLLAVDRNNSRVDRWYSHYHPSVVKVINHLIEQSRYYKKPISLCGDLGGDPRMALLLIGMGIESISLASGDLPRIKLLARAVSKQRCEQLVQQCLHLKSSDEIKHLLENEIEQYALEKLISASY